MVVPLSKGERDKVAEAFSFLLKTNNSLVENDDDGAAVFSLLLSRRCSTPQTQASNVALLYSAVDLACVYK